MKILSILNFLFLRCSISTERLINSFYPYFSPFCCWNCLAKISPSAVPRWKWVFLVICLILGRDVNFLSHPSSHINLFLFSYSLSIINLQSFVILSSFMSWGFLHNWWQLSILIIWPSFYVNLRLCSFRLRILIRLTIVLFNLLISAHCCRRILLSFKSIHWSKR